MNWIIGDKYFFTLAVRGGLSSYMRPTLQYEMDLLRLKAMSLTTIVGSIKEAKAVVSGLRDSCWSSWSTVDKCRPVNPMITHHS